MTTYDDWVEPVKSTDDFHTYRGHVARDQPQEDPMPQAATVTDPDVRWLVVTGAERSRLEAYLYGSANIVHDLGGHGFGDVFLVVVAEVAGQEGRAEFLADYQVGRLQSGLIPASVHGSYASAYNVAMDAATGVGR